MKVIFPAMRGMIGKRQYFSTMVALSEIPHLFKFNDWAECTPELRAQRVLNDSRVPDIARYIIENEDGYLFSSITASYDAKEAELRFVPTDPSRDVGNDVGNIELELERAQFVINDGQHRCAAITLALKDNPALGKEKISILLFPMENLQRLQQMFTDLNRYAHKTSKSLDILYDHRDSLSALTMEISEAVDVFRGLVDKERLSLQVRSTKLLTLATLYDANLELFADDVGPVGSDSYKRTLQTSREYWEEICKVIPEWRLVKEGKVEATQLRQEKINSHAVVIRALGGLGHALLESHPKDWKEKLRPLKDVDWRKANGIAVNKAWENVCIVAGSVVSNRQARAATLAKLMSIVGIAPDQKRTPVEKAASGTRARGNNVK